MARSLGLALYNLRPRTALAGVQDRPPRPPGRLVWMHAPNVDAARTLYELARRLIDEDGLTVLFTCPFPLPPRDGMLIQLPPADTPAEARAFLAHWRPDVGVFAEGEVRPALIHDCAERKIPLLMVDSRAPYILRERDGWYPGLMRTALASFAHVTTLDEAAARAFRRGGALLSAVSVTGRMEEQSAALPCLEAERASLARQLATRPVWFAACLPEAEEKLVIAAHREALRLAHRLLLIVAPQDPARIEPLGALMDAQEGWATASRQRDEEPEAESEAYLVDAAEYGLWYRLAPITFLGGSLSGTGALRNPLEAAALGSAILHGPRAGEYGATFGRLGAARATRAVASGRDLDEALGDLLDPDRAARLAQAAWTVASEGAEVTDRIATLIRHVMEGAT